MAHRPNILKLATKISLESMTYTGITYNDPEYKILEPIIDDDMCQIMMHMRLEANRTVEDIAKRAKKSVHHTQEQLDKLCKTGAVRARVRNGKTYYFYPSGCPASWRASWPTASSATNIPCSASALRNTPAAA